MNTSLRCLALTVAALSLAPLLPAPPTTLLAQGVSVVEPGDLAYRDINRLVQLGLLDSVIVGQGPYSRREMGRIVRIARDRLDRGGTAASLYSDDAELERAGGQVLARLEQRFGDEAEERSSGYATISPIDGFALIYTSTNAERRGFPSPATSPIEATIDPLAEPRLAQQAIPGNTVDLEVSQRVVPASWISFYARERLEARVPFDTLQGRSRGELLIASARALYRNVGLTIGREPLSWSQAEGDGLFFASDAPAVDQLSLASDEPFVLPGPLSRVGPMRATIVYAELGPSAVRNDSKLLAYKVSALPAGWLELGGTFMNHFGGEGGRETTFGNRLIDFLPFVDIFRRHNYTDSTDVSTYDVDSDKLLGLDGRVHLSRLAGMTIAGEMLIDDFDIHSVQRMLTGYGSQTVRVIFPMVGSPSLEMQVGAKHMGVKTYAHDALVSGIATRGRLLGDELGPDAKEFSAQLRWTPDEGGTLTIEAHEQAYSNATYLYQYVDSAHVQTSFTKVSSTPDERRHLVLASYLLRPDADMSLTFRAGVQESTNYAFTGRRRVDYVAGVALRVRQ